jgi:amidophosphoribosyltransferase
MCWGYRLIGDVDPGEALFIDAAGELYRKQCADSPKLRPCIFEHVYFARPDSLMDGISVYKTRMRQGERLARKIMRERPDHDVDVVIPIPDTSRVAGQGTRTRVGRQISRRIYEESLHWANIYHARANTTKEIGKAKAQSSAT